MLISIVIPTYNRYDLVLRAIDSTLKQTHKEVEIIVVDDCSRDSRYERLLNRTDIRYFKLEKRSGLPSVVRNFGIKKSIGNWIAFLDDDDYWLPHKLATQTQWTDSYNFISSDAYCLGKRWLKEINLQAWNQYNSVNTFVFNYDLIKQHNLIITSSVLIKKEILEQAGLIPEDRKFRGTEDYITWLEVLKRNNSCLFIDEALLEYDDSSFKYLRDNYV